MAQLFLSRSAVFAVLLTAWPFLNFINANPGQLQLRDLGFVLLAWAGTLIAMAVAAVALHLIRPRAHASQKLAAAAVFALSLVSVQPFQLLYPLSRGMLTAYALTCIALIAVAYLLARFPLARRAMAAFVIAVVLVPLTSLAVKAFGFASQRQDGSSTSEVWKQPIKTQPNIYWIITDGYSHATSLREFFDFDNSRFIGQMAVRGWTVPKRATSNYPITYLSLASTLAMDYVATPERPPFESREPFYEISRGRNPVVAALRAQGYRYVNINAGWGATRCSGIEDLCLKMLQGRAVSEAAYNLLQMTPLPWLRPGLFSISIADIPTINAALSELQLYKPFFLFAHTMPPHPPYERDAQCRPIAHTGSLLVWGSRNAYRDSVQCVNIQVLELIDEIAHRDPDAVVIINGDHGSGFLNQATAGADEWDQQMIDERFRIFLALRLPAECRGSVPEAVSLVNVFRIVAACLQNSKPQLLPDRYFVGGYETAREFGRTVEIKGPNWPPD